MDPRRVPTWRSRLEITCSETGDLRPPWRERPLINSWCFWDESWNVRRQRPAEDCVTETSIVPRDRCGVACRFQCPPPMRRLGLGRLLETVIGEEILILAAGLSQIIAEALIDRACRKLAPLENRLALEAAQAAVRRWQGYGHASKPVDRAIDAHRTPPETPKLGAPLRQLREYRYRPVYRRRSWILFVQALPPEHAVVASAQASLAWNWPADRRDEVLEQVLRVKRLPRLGPPSLLIGRTFTRVLVEAATMLLPSRPELAPVVAEATKHASVGGARELRGVLFRNGHQEIAMESFRLTHESAFSEKMAKSFRRMDKDHDDILEMLVQLSPHADLSLSQERRLSELASFVETLNLDDFSAWLSGDKWRALRSDWVHLIATLGGFDKSVVAKQAAVVRRGSGG